MTGRFLAIALKHDPVALSRAATIIDAANDDSFDWQSELDNDPDYLDWLEARAEEEEMRHANW